MCCGKKLDSRFQIKFCSNQCQAEYSYDSYIRSWKAGVKNTPSAKNISKHIKKYLLNKADSKCSLCGWGKIHPVTGIAPLEVDHIDGDANNNRESNLRVLCPNCHALTPSFKNLNRGKGRKWRRDRYVKN
jgi:ribosomal protein L34E